MSFHHLTLTLSWKERGNLGFPKADFCLSFQERVGVR